MHTSASSRTSSRLQSRVVHKAVVGERGGAVELVIKSCVAAFAVRYVPAIDDSRWADCSIEVQCRGSMGDKGSVVNERRDR